MVMRQEKRNLTGKQKRALKHLKQMRTAVQMRRARGKLPEDPGAEDEDEHEDDDEVPGTDQLEIGSVVRTNQPTWVYKAFNSWETLQDQGWVLKRRRRNRAVTVAGNTRPTRRPRCSPCTWRFDRTGQTDRGAAATTAAALHI